MDEFAEIERRGARLGLNPMFGEWQHRFNFAPVVYSNGGMARAKFKARIRDELKNDFIYVGELSFNVTLYLEEEKLLESAAYGDVDNHAKSLLDALKGKGGLFVDDSQVQHLDISWIDVPDSPRFDVSIKSGPDDFLLTPIELFEMPDGLFYPFSTRVWTQQGPEDLTASDTRALLEVTAAMTREKKRLRHRLRLAGLPQFRAFQHSRYVSPALMGLHRTKVEGSGFRLVTMKEWRA